MDCIAKISFVWASTTEGVSLMLGFEGEICVAAEEGTPATIFLLSHFVAINSKKGVNVERSEPEVHNEGCVESKDQFIPVLE